MSNDNSIFRMNDFYLRTFFWISFIFMEMNAGNSQLNEFWNCLLDVLWMSLMEVY